jgi:hypothetical protein
MFRNAMRVRAFNINQANIKFGNRPIARSINFPQDPPRAPHQDLPATRPKRSQNPPLSTLLLPIIIVQSQVVIEGDHFWVKVGGDCQAVYRGVVGGSFAGLREEGLNHQLDVLLARGLPELVRGVLLSGSRGRCPARMGNRTGNRSRCSRSLC